MVELQNCHTTVNYMYEWRDKAPLSVFLAGPSSWVTNCMSVLWSCTTSSSPSSDSCWVGYCSWTGTKAWKDPWGQGDWNQEKANPGRFQCTASQEDPGRWNQVSHHPSFLEVKLYWNSHKVSVINFTENKDWAKYITFIPHLNFTSGSVSVISQWRLYAIAW